MIPILFDLDGVVAHFTNGACDVHGLPRSAGLSGAWNFHHPHGISDAAFYAPMGRDFWADLGVWPDGIELFKRIESLVGHERIAFLSSPCQTAGCEEGKRIWFKRHFPQYDPWGDLFLGGKKQKLAYGGAILLDDSDTNCERWAARGGRSFLIPRPWNKDRDQVDAEGLFHVGNVQQAFARAIK
jgi:hypothetical protein